MNKEVCVAHLFNAYVFLGISIVAWGLEYPLLRRSTTTIGFLATGGVMFSLAAVLLGGVIVARRCAGRTPDAAGKAGLPYVLLALVGVIGTCVNVLGLWAAKLTSVANMATLARTDVLFALLLAAFVFRQTVDRRVYLCVPVMLAGICLLTGFFARSPELGRPGDFLILGSAFFVGLNTFVIKYTLRRASPVTVAWWNSTMIGITLLAAALASGGWAGSFAQLPAGAWLILAALGCLVTVFFLSYYAALRALPVWEVRLLSLGIPVVAALAGWVWPGETPTLLQWLGMLLVAAGAAGIILVRQRKGIAQHGTRRGVHV